jgi:hypothetical protein
MILTHSVVLWTSVVKGKVICRADKRSWYQRTVSRENGFVLGELCHVWNAFLSADSHVLLWRLSAEQATLCIHYTVTSSLYEYGWNSFSLTLKIQFYDLFLFSDLTKNKLSGKKIVQNKMQIKFGLMGPFLITTGLIFKISVFWNITPYSPWKVGWCFEIICYLHLQGWSVSKTLFGWFMLISCLDGGDMFHRNVG